MRDHLTGAIFAILLVAVLAASERPAQDDYQRFVIYGRKDTPEVLLDTETGHSWIKQMYVGDDRGTYPHMWYPIRFIYADTVQAIFDPYRASP